MKQILNNWIFKSSLIGLGTGLISLIFIPSLIFGFIVFLITTVILILNNPKRRFMKAFWIVFSAFVAMNKLSMWIAGSLLNVDFFISSTILEWSLSAFLIILAGLLLILDYFERSNKNIKLPSLIKFISKSNSGNYTRVEAGATINQIIVQGDYIERGNETKNINDFDEIKQLLKREEELQILVKNSSDMEKIDDYQKELSELKSKAELTKKEITEISKTINLLSTRYPDQANQASQFLLSGSYTSVKDYFMSKQEERQGRKLAEKLGIEYDELLELDYWIEDGHRSTDGMLYYYNIWFNEDSPEEIIEKIDGVEKLGDTYCLEVSPWFFDEPEEYEFEE